MSRQLRRLQETVAVLAQLVAPRRVQIMCNTVYAAVEHIQVLGLRIVVEQFSIHYTEVVVKGNQVHLLLERLAHVGHGGFVHGAARVLHIAEAFAVI